MAGVGWPALSLTPQVTCVEGKERRHVCERREEKGGEEGRGEEEGEERGREERGREERGREGGEKKGGGKERRGRSNSNVYMYSGTAYNILNVHTPHIAHIYSIGDTCEMRTKCVQNKVKCISTVNAFKHISPLNCLLYNCLALKCTYFPRQ